MATLLVVDDSKIDLKRASLLLTKHIPEAEILCAAQGVEALEQIEQHAPDVVITDLQMPIMNGLELVERIRQKYPQIPVILMTAAGSEEIATAALRKGAACYVPKRELAVDLAPIVARLLGAARERIHHLRILNSISEVSFELQNDRELLVDFVYELREFLQHRGIFAEHDCFRVAMAIDEALANAYYHGNLEVSSKLREQDCFSFERLASQRREEQPYAHRKIFLKISLGEELRVTIRDQGPGFDLSMLPDPFDPSFVERPCGRGVVLMRSFMDSIEFNEFGNQVTMVKKINGTEIASKP